MKKTNPAFPLLSAFFIFFYTAQAAAQLSTSDAIGIGRSIFDSKKQKREKQQQEKKEQEQEQAKDQARKENIANIENHLREATVNGRSILLLRVPEETITSAAKSYILKVQKRLEENFIHYRNNEHIAEYSYNIQHDIIDVKSFDANWPITYYEIELREYRAYEQHLTQQEEKTKDSLVKANYAAELKKREEERLARQFTADSLAYEQQVADFHFVNKTQTDLKLKPDAKSVTLAKVNGGSYISVWEINEKTGWAKVSLRDIEGYMLYAHLVEYLEEIDFPGSDIDLYKKERYYSYVRNEAYFEKLYKAEEEKAMREAAAEERRQRAAGPRYHTGERGGCYYLDSRGKKVYVDRGNCR